MRFRGRSDRALDNKGRLMLPPNFRDILLARMAEANPLSTANVPESPAPTKLVLTSYDGCIVGFSLPDWEKLEDGFARLKTHNRLVRDFKRLVIGGAEEVLLDSQGRIRLPQALMTYAGLSKDVVVLGQSDKFEIWDSARFDALTAQDFSDVADELAESGISLSL